MITLHPRHICLLVSLAAATVLALPALSAPIDFSEVSLLVRARESEPSIIHDVAQRKLIRPLTAAQESTLRAQGANDSLLQALRNSHNVLAPQDADSFEQAKAGRAHSFATAAKNSAGGEQAEWPEDFHVVDVSVGHPINLSQWGGPDCELAFNGATRLDEGREDAVLINTAGSFTHVATYLAVGRADDDTTILDRRNYVSVMDHTFTRGLRIDRQNPVRRKGVPYTLYPVYATGGVSLYYIGGTCDSVKLAVSTTGR